MVSAGVGRPEPASWWEEHAPGKFHVGTRASPSDPVYPWDRLRPIPIEAMNSIQRMQLTWPA
jgi:hypothetical protein